MDRPVHSFDRNASHTWDTYCCECGADGEKTCSDIDAEYLDWAEKRIQDHEAEITRLQKPWISVDERLPETTQPVLVGFGGRGTAMQAMYFSSVGFSIYPVGHVTHWMPIPALPEDKT